MKARLAVLAIMASLASHAACAAIVFDTVNYGTINGISGPGSDGSEVALQSFTASPQFDFKSITLSLTADTPGDGGSILVYLFGDSGSAGTPGVATGPDFANMSPIGIIPDSALNETTTGVPTLVTLADISTFLPNGTVNDEYWIGLDFVSDNSSGEWVYNTDATGVGTAGQSAYTDNIGDIYALDGSVQGAFGVIVNTPEPMTVALLGGALTGLGVFRSRRKKQQP
jgi:hypothetical protein